MDTTKLLSLYRIKHRIPGRIRIHIPALEKMPSEWHALSDTVQALITSKEGISEARIEPISGSVILRYRAEVIDDREVLNWLELLVRRFLDSVPFSTRRTREEYKSSLKRLKYSL